MSHRKALSQWEASVSTHLGHLSRTPRPRASVMELRDGAGQVLRDHQCRGSAGRCAGLIGVYTAATVTEVVL